MTVNFLQSLRSRGTHGTIPCEDRRVPSSSFFAKITYGLLVLVHNEVLQCCKILFHSPLKSVATSMNDVHQLSPGDEKGLSKQKGGCKTIKKSMKRWVRRLGYEPMPHRLPDRAHWTNHVAAQTFGYFICKMG